MCDIPKAHIVPARKMKRNMFLKSDTTTVYVDGSGKKRFKGSDTLKSSQTYPPRFGKAVARPNLARWLVTEYTLFVIAFA